MAQTRLRRLPTPTPARPSRLLRRPTPLRLPRPSPAPLSAIFLYGGDHVAAWLAQNGWKRTDYDLASASRLGREYDSFWTNQSPLGSDDCAAVLHGWHHLWPNDAFYMPAEMSLLLWTFWDAEPWLELWHRRPNFHVELRIT